MSIADNATITSDDYILINGINEIPLEKQGEYSELKFYFSGSGMVEIKKLALTEK